MTSSERAPHLKSSLPKNLLVKTIAFTSDGSIDSENKKICNLAADAVNKKHLDGEMDVAKENFKSILNIYVGEEDKKLKSIAKSITDIGNKVIGFTSDGSIDFNLKRIVNLADPIDNTNAVNMRHMNA